MMSSSLTKGASGENSTRCLAFGLSRLCCARLRLWREGDVGFLLIDESVVEMPGGGGERNEGVGISE